MSLAASSPLRMDRVRAWVEGTMPAADRPSFAAEVASDPDLREAVATYAEVRAVTDDPAPACRLSADDLVFDDVPASPEARLHPLLSIPAVRAAAAALLLALGVVAWRLSASPTGPTGPTGSAGRGEGDPVSLLALRPEPPATTPKDAPPIPAGTLATLASYGPTGPADGGRLFFLEDLSEARAVAAALRRPLLAFVYHPTCPWCQAMAKGAFRDGGVAAAADPFVLVRLNVETLDDAVGREVGSLKVGWPIFWAEDSAGTRKHAFGGEQTAATLTKALRAAALAAPPGADAIPWAAAREAARALADAEHATEPGKRYAALLTVVTKDPRGPLGARARTLAYAEESAARDALLFARSETARGGAAAGIRSLDAALPRFRDTPLGLDLEAVRARLDRDGSFPPLRAPTRAPLPSVPPNR